ncbi:MAG: hypothetical protein A4E73_03827 [Syntrophaceae bacterium PtaU1.Bin231]|nr:MAG: hypothetical protein A4E73_03827 [Syntrophaceae bacterium PtaU1.Bin231]
MATRSIAGGVPEPDELFGREHVINYIWEQLAGNNIFLVAPRRFGKTGVMGHLLKRPRGGHLPVYLEVEELHDSERFGAALIAALLEQSTLRTMVTRAKGLPGALMDFISNRIQHIKTEVVEIELRDLVKDSWESVTRALILEMEKADETVLFIIDEFPQFIENVARKHGDETARAFLQWFRSLRMRQKDVLRRYRFVLGGSTSIDMILRRLDVPDKLNDFFRVPIEALTPEAAEDLLASLSSGYNLRFSNEARKALFDLISPSVPYFLQWFVSQLRMEENLKGKELRVEDVTDVYQRRVLGPTCRAYFDYYRSASSGMGNRGNGRLWRSCRRSPTPRRAGYRTASSMTSTARRERKMLRASSLTRSWRTWKRIGMCFSTPEPTSTGFC